MSREETAGESLCEGIMEGSLRAVDRTMIYQVSCSRLQRNFHVTGKHSNVISTLQESSIVSSVLAECRE